MKTKFETSAGGIVYKREKTRKNNSSQKNADVIWLICQHSQYKGWIFPKGLIDDMKKGETMEDAALREVEEEGGIKARIINDQPIKVQYSYRFKDALVKKTVYYFLMEYVSGDPKNHDWEISQAKFVTAEEVKKTLTYKIDKEAFKKILSMI